MNFEKAIPYLKNGASIYRKSWQNKEHYFNLKDIDKTYYWIIPIRDIIANDWAIKDNNLCRYYKDITQLLIQGCKFRRLDWEEPSYIYMDMEDGCIYINNSSGNWFYSPHRDDFLYKDWIQIFIQDGRESYSKEKEEERN